MTSAQKQKLLDLRVKAKLGKILTPDEQAFCEAMWHLYPGDYPSDTEIFKLVEQYVNPLAGG